MTNDFDGQDVQLGSDTQLDCDWCRVDPHSGQRPASYGITLTTCCQQKVSDYLLCEQHWHMLRDQPFPVTCPNCGAVTDSIDDVVITVMPFGTVDTFAEKPIEGPSETAPADHEPDRPSTGGLPTVIREPASSPTEAAPEPSEPMYVDEVDNDDYPLMAEREWVQTRTEAIHTDCDRQYGAAIAQLETELNKATDPDIIYQLSQQLSQHAHHRDTAVQQAQDRLAHDRHAYAVWRQTPDGIYFENWIQRAFTVTSWIFDRDDEWSAAWKQMLNDIPAADREAHASGQWVPRPRRHRIMRWARDAAALVCLAGLIGAMFNALLLILATAGAAGVAYAMLSARDPLWERRNADAQAIAHRARVQRFGFDPLDEPDRVPNWSTHPNPRRYAFVLQATALVGFESHPRPNTLPEPQYLPLAQPDTVPAELRPLITPRR